MTFKVLLQGDRVNFSERSGAKICIEVTGWGKEDEDEDEDETEDETEDEDRWNFYPFRQLGIKL